MGNCKISLRFHWTAVHDPCAVVAQHPPPQQGLSPPSCVARTSMHAAVRSSVVRMKAKTTHATATLKTAVSVAKQTSPLRSLRTLINQLSEHEKLMVRCVNLKLAGNVPAADIMHTTAAGEECRLDKNAKCKERLAIADLDRSLEEREEREEFRLNKNAKRNERLDVADLDRAQLGHLGILALDLLRVLVQLELHALLQAPVEIRDIQALVALRVLVQPELLALLRAPVEIRNSEALLRCELLRSYSSPCHTWRS